MEDERLLIQYPVKLMEIKIKNSDTFHILQSLIGELSNTEFILKW